MASSAQKSNARLAIYAAPVAISFIFALATGGVVNLPFVAILSSIQALLGKEGFAFVKEALALLGAGGVNLLTGEAHERIKTFFKGFQSEKLLNDEKLQETVKNTIIYILNEEKEKPEFADQKENIERLIKALEKFYEKTIALKTEDINQDIQQAILDSFIYEAKDLTRSASPLSANEWKNLLEDTAIVNSDSFYEEGIGFRLDIPADFKIPLKELAKSLEEKFPSRFQSFLEKNLSEGGETFAKFVLDFLKKIDSSGDEIKNILAEYKQEIEEINQNTSLALQQGQINHAELREFLDKISLQIDNLQNGLASDGKTVSAAYISQINKEIKEGFQQHNTQIALVISLIRNLPSQFAAEMERRNPKSPKPKPQALIGLPRQKNDFFVEQGNIFSRLDAELNAHNLAYLHGTHGLGKTTTLIEYAYAKEKAYDFIFYVLATDGAIEGELARFADEFLENISDTDTPAQKAAKVKDYLEENVRWTKESKNWLIIFDNLESPKRISEYFPKTAKGDCLYACNRKMYLINDREVEFEQFSQEEAELFLYKKLSEKKEVEHRNIPQAELDGIRSVINRLGKIPLALNIAGSYIKETSISYAEYVELIEANIKKHLKFRDEHKQHQSETAFDAFLVSLNKIKEFDANDEDSETVAELAGIFLDLCSFCPPEDIPEELIEKTLFRIVEISAVTATAPKFLFRETVGLLKKFDLIRERQKSFRYKHKLDKPQILADGTTVTWEFRETGINVFDTYRTLQNILSIKLDEETKKILIEQIITALSGLLPINESQDRADGMNFMELEIYEKYAATAFSIIQAAEKQKVYIWGGLRICNEIGIYLQEASQYQQSEFFLEKAKIIAENLFEDDHNNIATIYSNLAVLYEEQGKYEKAEALYKDSIKIFEKVDGEKHFNTATGYNNLARFFLYRSNLEAAELLFIKVKDILEETAPAHPNMASTYSNLAALYDAQGRYSEAEPFHLKGLNLRKELFGELNPDTALSYANLGIHYYAQEDYEKAEPLFKRAIQIREQILSHVHPDAVKTYNSLAGLYFKQQRYEETEPLLQKILEINRQIYGETHSWTIKSHEALADFYYQLGKYKEAKSIYESVKSVYESDFNEDISNLGIIYMQLAVIYKSLEKSDEAVELLKKAAKFYREQLGKEHPQTIAIEINLANFYLKQQRFEEAETLYEKNISFYEKEVGENHISTGIYYNQLALVYKSLEKFEQAASYFRKVKTVYEKKYGKSHLNTAIVYKNLADTLQDLEKYQEAAPLYKKAIGIFEKYPSENPPWNAVLYNNLANNYRKQKDYKKAEPLYKKAIEIYKNSDGENHSNTAIVRGNYSRLLFEQGKIEEALDLSENALKVLKNELPANHAHVKKQEQWNEEIKEKIRNTEN